MPKMGFGIRGKGFAAVGIDGLDDSLRKLDQIGANVDKATGNVMLQLAQKVANEAISILNSHTNSTSGGSPASRSGSLANSIIARLIHETGSEVLVNADYAKHLEFGTRKMFEHPFMRLAIALVLPEFSVQERMAIYIAVDQLNKHKSDFGSLGSIPGNLLK